MAFMRAAVWPDDIKESWAGYTNDGDIPKDEASGQNIGYEDKRQHRYWHYKDIGFSTDGTAVPVPDRVNAATQMRLFIAALPWGSGANNSVRSYDLVWLLHLVSDVHQPLHATARASKNRPRGDRGGNEVKVRPATGEEINLHLYWDRMFGGYVTPFGAMRDAFAPTGIGKLAVDPGAAAIDDPDVWLTESSEIAKSVAYAEPVLSGTEPIELTRAYETNAYTTARARAALAAHRLANLLNKAFP